MKWKKGSTDFLSEKTFLIIREDSHMLEGKIHHSHHARAKPTTKTDTWPPKMKRVQSLYEDLERPRTANLEKPSVLDPKLVDKLDMSVLSKELLGDSMTRFQLGESISGGTASPTAASRRRQNVAVRQKRRSFEQILDIRIGQSESPRLQKQLKMTTQETNIPKKIIGDFRVRKLDDNNNRNNKITLSTVKKKSAKAIVGTDLEVFTSIASPKNAPEPCNACGRSDQPERFHSHPRGTHLKIKTENGVPNANATTNANATASSNVKTKPLPKTVQKPVALNFRSDRRKSKEEGKVCESKEESRLNMKNSQEQENEEYRSARSASTPGKKGPRTVTCYICGREFGTASFPIHEPRCMQKWERENSSLPLSQRRPPPQRPATEASQYEWNEAAWEQSQAQLLPCSRCGRTFLPERLPVHQRSCKATPKNLPAEKVERRTVETLDKRNGNISRPGPPTVPCRICGRNFGTRSIKIHEPQCTKRREMENQKKGLERLDDSLGRSAEIPQKRTVTCYICGRDFGTTSIGIHEPQCLKKWQVENEKLPPGQRRKEPEKPEIIYTSESESGKTVVDTVAMAEASWNSHLRQLVPCKRCGRTFNPDRVGIHERSCKGNR